MYRLRIHETVSPRGVEPAELGHVEIHDDHIEPLVFEHIERLLPVVHDPDPVPGALEYPDDDALIDGIVFGHQNLVAAPVGVAGSVVIAERNDAFLAALNRSGRVNDVEQEPRLERHLQHRHETSRKRIGTANLRYAGRAQDRRGRFLAAAVAQPPEDSVRFDLRAFAHEHQVVGMAERLRFGKARRRGLDPRRAPGARPPSGEILLEPLQLRVGETEQHDPAIVEPQRSLGYLSPHLLLEGQLEPEQAALPRRAVQADLPAHHLHELLGDGGAEPGTSVAARGGVVGLDETLENAFLGLGRDAYPRVLDGKSQSDRVFALAQAGNAQGDAAGLGELDAVSDEVVEHLAQMIGIAAQRVRHFRHHVSPELQPADLGLRREYSRSAVDQAMQVEIGFFDIDLAGLDLGNVEHVLDQFEHGLRSFVHRLHHLDLLRVQAGVAQQVVHSDDGVERGAHLVAHRGEESAFGLVRGLGAVHRIEQPLYQRSDIHRQHGHPHQQSDA